jgi:hypothetical protein
MRTPCVPPGGSSAEDRIAALNQLGGHIGGAILLEVAVEIATGEVEHVRSAGGWDRSADRAVHRAHLTLDREGGSRRARDAEHGGSCE